MNNCLSKTYFFKNKISVDKKENSANNVCCIEQDFKLLSELFKTLHYFIGCLENLLPLCKNKTLQNLISIQQSKYEIMLSECKLLAKANDITLCKREQFLNFKKWIDTKIGGFLDNTSSTISYTIYLSVYNSLPQLDFVISSNNGANKVVLELAKKAHKLGYENLYFLQKTFCINP